MSDGKSFLKQKMGQKLSSRQIQLMNLIALPITELQERIKLEIEENPALEEGFPTEEEDLNNADQSTDITEKELVLGDYASLDDVPDNKLQHFERHATPGVEIPFAEETSLHEHLSSQLGFTKLNEEERSVAEFILGSLDEDGYLRRDTEALLDDLAIYRGIYMDPKAIDQIVHVLQSLDPAGIAARDLRECLLLQLSRREPTPTVNLAIDILNNHFSLFSSRSFKRLQEVLHTDAERLREAVHLITHLNPSPGLDFTSRLEDTLQTIIPDFYVREEDGDPVVYLNRADTPQVRIDPSFSSRMEKLMLRKSTPSSSSEKETTRFVKKKIEDARWFVEMIRQRTHTLMETMSTIVALQREYFLTGDTHQLRPMILKDVADRTGYDISTISRVTSTKYVQTDFGIFSLKRLFSEGTTTDEGEEITSVRVREVLKEIIEKENKQKPYPDEELVRRLKANGISLARRTVAKYREMMGIPVARLRKEV